MNRHDPVTLLVHGTWRCASTLAKFGNGPVWQMAEVLQQDGVVVQARTDGEGGALVLPAEVDAGLLRRMATDAAAYCSGLGDVEGAAEYLRLMKKLSEGESNGVRD